MENIELLVHISAPARLQDDKKYLSLCQSIIDFEPVTVSRAADSELRPPVTPQEGNSLYSQPLPSSSGSSHYGLSSPTPNAASSARRKTRPAQHNPTDHGSARIQRESSNHNPPCKNPYHGRPHSKLPTSIYETPDQSRRPQTAPGALPSTVHVPRTGPALRRTQSASTSFSSLASHISNSQPSENRETHGHENANGAPSSTYLRGGFAEDHASIIRNLSQTSLDEADEAPRKRRKLEQEVEHGRTRCPRPPGTEAYLLLDRSLDWTSSPQSSQELSDTVSSTATPSQPLQGHSTDAQTKGEPPDPCPPPVILISSESETQAETVPVYHQEIDSSGSERRTFDASPDSSRAEHIGQAIAHRSLFNILGLAPEVAPPQPQVEEERFVTHITKSLQDFARQLPFARFFHPVEVSRDVRVLERGYWVMEVKIATARSAARGETHGHTIPGRVQGTTAAARLREHDESKRDGSLNQSGESSECKAPGLWTEEELVQFWQSFSSFLENGKAGWGTRLVGEELGDGSADGVRKVRIRVFTWGEVLGHIYLAIWVLSDKLAARIPMQWVASDGTQVVKMAATRAARASLPPWSRKGLEGEKGCWGVATVAD